MSTLAISFLRLLSFLPLPVLYVLSGFVCIVLRDLAGYRKEVITGNLERSFPELSPHEITGLRIAYYRHMADLIVETIKINVLSERALRMRCRFRNPEVITNLLNEGKNVLIMLGHTGNWEWAGLAAQSQFEAQCLPVYRALHNRAFDRYYHGLRSKNGARPVEDTEATAVIPRVEGPKVVAMLADQTPGGRKGWWTSFLHQPTPFFRGSEILAKRLNYPVVYGQVDRVRQGHYEVTLELLSASPRQEETFAITQRFAKTLERHLQENKVNWLWSHRRWKHTPDEQSTWMERGEEGHDL